jgi:hypothetical protein
MQRDLGIADSDAIYLWASPPCEAYSILGRCRRQGELLINMALSTRIIWRLLIQLRTSLCLLLHEVLICLLKFSPLLRTAHS